LDPIQFVKAQRRVLEDLFDSEWFSRPYKRHHPAYRRWDLCNEILSRGGRVSVENQEGLADLIFDNFGIVQVSQGKIDDFLLGQLANYGDENVQKRLRRIIDDPNQFLDILFEINYAAWQIARGHHIRAFESEGLPDFEIFIEPSRVLVAADCKRVRADTSNERFRKLILKANKQIKNLGKECPGLAVIDISAKLPQQGASRDSLLPHVDRICQILKQYLQRDNSSVTGSLVTWRSTQVLPMTDGSGGTLYVLNQHSRIVRHTRPLRDLPEKELSRVAYDSMLALKILPL
jgi:hypothetical protein